MQSFLVLQAMPYKPKNIYCVYCLALNLKMETEYAAAFTAKRGHITFDTVVAGITLAGLLSELSQSSRIDFDEKEAKSICYGIMATATKANVALRSPQGTETAVDRFLANMDWNDCGNYRKECVAHRTKLFATDEVVYTEPIIQNFLSFINHMSCSADIYVSLGGSNGCADQLTNWDGTQKMGLGATSKKKSQGLSR